MTDRAIHEPERRIITGIARTRWWELEKEGQAPRRRRLVGNRVCWLESELLEWLRSRPVVERSGTAA